MPNPKEAAETALQILKNLIHPRFFESAIEAPETDIVLKSPDLVIIAALKLADAMKNHLANHDADSSEQDLSNTESKLHQTQADVLALRNMFSDHIKSHQAAITSGTRKTLEKIKERIEQLQLDIFVHTERLDALCTQIPHPEEQNSSSQNKPKLLD